MKKFFVAMMVLCASGLAAQADETLSPQQDEQLAPAEQLFEMDAAEAAQDEAASEDDGSLDEAISTDTDNLVEPRGGHAGRGGRIGGGRVGGGRSSIGRGRPGFGFRPRPGHGYRPRPVPHPRPFPRPRPYPRPFPRPVPRPYPPYYPAWFYECSAQDAYGRTYVDNGRIDPRVLQNNVVYTCEVQSGTTCVALGCRRVY